MKILIVDSHPEGIYMLQALFLGYGYEVDSASDGRRALELASAGPYDLIVSETLMPRMDGFELCRELKKDPRLRPIPLVFLSAHYPDFRDIAYALSLGAVRFLRKPIEPEELMKNIREVLEKKRPS